MHLLCASAMEDFSSSFSVLLYSFQITVNKLLLSTTIKDALKYRLNLKNFTFSKETLSLNAVRLVTPYEIKPLTQVGSTSANARNAKAASIRT